MIDNIQLNIPSDVSFILDLLNSSRYKSYIVGGCVRDILLDKEPKDWDITTDATPTQVIEVFNNFRVIETGIQHGTVSVLINDVIYEVTSFRIDGEYTDNRRPNSVEFTSNLEDDLKRRDFTINAMAYNPTEGLIDLFNGQEDLNNEIIRCVGIPNERFNEDGLRILRALRFASVLCFEIEKETSISVFYNRDLLRNISKERIAVEFNKILMAENSYDILMEFKEVFSVFISELIPTFDFNQNNPYHTLDIYEHMCVSTYNVQQDLVLKLTMFLHDIGKPLCYTETFNDELNKNIGHFYGHAKISSEIVEVILRRLKYDNDTIRNVVQLVFYHDILFINTETYIKKLLNKISEKTFRQLIKVRIADIEAQNPIYSDERINKVLEVEKTLNKVISEQQCFCLKELTINGDILIEIGFKGVEIGNILKDILDKVINDELNNIEEDLILYAKNIYFQKKY